jgi:hypothetical protein
LIDPAAGIGALPSQAWAVQPLVRASEPHPEARIANDLIPWLGADIGALLGLAVGAERWTAAIFGGAIVDLLRERDVPAGVRHAH